MEPGDGPPPASGQGSPAHIEHENLEGQTLLKQRSGKRNASSLCLPAPSCHFPVKHLQRLWWTKSTLAVVTGGNKGLGLEIARQLAIDGLTVVLTARDPTKGSNAVSSLRDEGIESIIFHPLDVSSPQSVNTFAAWFEKAFEGLDILINNAGVHYYSESYEDAVETIETNYYGVKRVTTALLPLMRKSHAGARVVNVSSQAASLNRFKSRLKDKVSNVDILSEAMVDDFATKYLEDVKAGRWRDVEKGKWAANNYQYCESKLLLNTYTQILARSLAFKQPQNHKIFVNAICPGSVQTDMAAFVVRKATEAGNDILQDVFGGCTIQSFENGADAAVWLALLPRAGYPNGRFFAHAKEISF